MHNIQFLSGEEASEALNREEGKYTLALTHNLVGGFADDYRRVTDNSPDAEIDWQPCVEHCLKSVENLKREGNIFVVLQDGKPVGMQGYKYAGQDPTTGQGVYELAHGSILEEAEGRGYLKKLVSLTLQNIREKHGCVHVIFGSSNKNFAEKLASRFHFEPMSLERLYQIDHSKMDVSEYTQEIETKRKNGITFYLLPGK
ncbi:MAG: GNAT family N-acetyltransferase [Candidatus Peregrinibacteria bacterium]|nr:GNAT family N-acetyltransferase [Candidatus Peregrinibacteria bacterium]